MPCRQTATHAFKKKLSMPKVDLAFRLLCDWLAAGAPFLHPAVLADVDTGAGYRHLLDLGLAKPECRLLEDIACPWCSTGTLHQVCRIRGGIGGNAYRGLRLGCGWQNIPAAQLSPLALDLPKIARAVAAALGLASRYETHEIVPGKLWRIGEREVARKRHQVWFAPVPDLRCPQACQQALSRWQPTTIDEVAPVAKDQRKLNSDKGGPWAGCRRRRQALAHPSQPKGKMRATNRRYSTMASAALKHEVEEIMEKLPDTATLNDLLYALEVHADIEAGLRDSDEGRVVSNADVRKLFGLSE